MAKYVAWLLDKTWHAINIVAVSWYGLDNLVGPYQLSLPVPILYQVGPYQIPGRTS